VPWWETGEAGSSSSPPAMSPYPRATPWVLKWANARVPIFPLWAIPEVTTEPRDDPSTCAIRRPSAPCQPMYTTLFVTPDTVGHALRTSPPRAELKLTATVGVADGFATVGTTVVPVNVFAPVIVSTPLRWTRSLGLMLAADDAACAALVAAFWALVLASLALFVAVVADELAALALVPALVALDTAESRAVPADVAEPAAAVAELADWVALVAALRALSAASFLDVRADAVLSATCWAVLEAASAEAAALEAEVATAACASEAVVALAAAAVALLPALVAWVLAELR